MASTLGREGDVVMSLAGDSGAGVDDPAHRLLKGGRIGRPVALVVPRSAERRGLSVELRPVAVVLTLKWGAAVGSAASPTNAAP